MYDDRAVSAATGVHRRRVVALVPAHDEAEQIAATVSSLLGQTIPPDRIVVMADNCTDDTVAVARRAGATVYETVANRGKKAGALNQGVDLVSTDLVDDDLLLVMDADSVLCPEWIERALSHLAEDPDVGAVSGAYVARRGRGLISLLQGAEYAQERRRISRRGGLVDVLSGTSVLVPVGIVRRLAEARGFVYDETSLTEDFEITLAIQSLGYRPRCFRDLQVITDVMETWKDLARQRIRWQRGTIETLLHYGWTPITRRLWLTQTVAYGSTLIALLVLFAWASFSLDGGSADLRWLTVIPVFSAEQALTSRRAGARSALVAALLLPMWGYDLFRLAVYWTALLRSLRGTAATWV